MERLQKILSKAGVASRRAAEVMIAEGRVTVDGICVRELGQKYEASEHLIAVDGKLIEREGKVYFLLNKPKGYLSAVKDDRGRKTVLALIPDVRERIYPVGRLDYETEGLLLLTNDGDLMNALLHPRYHVKKTYEAVCNRTPTEEELDKLRVGIQLEDGMTQPAEVCLLPKKNTIAITIQEGRNRQVRRMLAAIGYEILGLKRVSFGTLHLDVPCGKYRSLAEEEVQKLYKVSGIE